MLDFTALQQAYPDVKAWLTIPGTAIDYPVAQSSIDDPEFYLRRNLNGQRRVAGTLFFQADCSIDGKSLQRCQGVNSSSQKNGYATYIA